jgi:hypothetical protein
MRVSEHPSGEFQPSPSQPRSKRPVWIVGGVAAILILCCIVAMAVSFFGGRYLSPQATNTPPPAATTFPTSTARPTATPTQTSEPTPTPTQTPRPTATPTPAPGEVVLAESFSDADSEGRWNLEGSDGHDFRIRDGKLLASGSDPDRFDWTESTGTYSNLDLQVDATVLEGGAGAVFGLVFLLDASGNNYKACLIYGDGSAYWGKRVSGELEWGDRVKVGLSPRGDANVMRLIVVGEQWALYVNEQCLGSGTSFYTQRRRIGLLVSTDSEDTTRIEYDDLIIKMPDGDIEGLLTCDPVPYSSAPTPTQPPIPTPPPPPPPSTNGTIYLSSQTSAASTCRISVWGNENFQLDAGPGSPASRQVAPGDYGWQVFFGNRQTAPSSMQIRAGGQCSFTCYDNEVRWGCN